MAVGLHREGAAPAERSARLTPRQAVREAGTDDDVRGIGGHPSRPGQVVGQGRPQRRDPARVRVAEQVIGSGREDLAGRREPARRGNADRSGTPARRSSGATPPREGRRPPRPDRAPGAARRRYPTRSARSAIPPRPAGCRPRRPCCGRCSGPRPGRATTAAAYPGAGGRPGPRRERALQPGPHPVPERSRCRSTPLTSARGRPFGPCFWHRNGPYLGPLSAVASVV